MDPQSILELLQYGERITLECKKARHELPKSIWETYSSFSNTIGGTILLGIDENPIESDTKKRFTIEGVENPDRLIKDFWNVINSSKVNVNTLIDQNVGTCVVQSKTILWIEVPQAPYQRRPVYINENLNKGTYKRNFEGDYHCTEEEIKAMLRDASDTGNDGGLLDGYTMDDIDPDTLKAYRIEYELRNPDHIWNTLDNKEFLRNLGGYTFDRITKREGLTTAGLLMFGKGLSIRERFDNIRMDYIDLTNLLPNSRWSDRITYDGMWENNLYNFLKRVIPKLVSDLKRPFQLDGITRVDDTPVHKAIREAVVNMIIHSDYLITGILKVEKREDCFLFSNPGNLKLPVLSIYEGGHSVARNPRIQTMFRMIGLGDNIGSGFPAILHTWGVENWRKPDLRENTELHQVSLQLWMVSLMPAECSVYLQQLFGIAYQHLTREEQIILATAYLEKSVSNLRLQSVLGLHPTEVGKFLAALVEKEMLLINPKGRWTTYVLNTGYQCAAEQLSLTDTQPKTEKLKATDQLIYDFVCTNGYITSSQVVAITQISTLQGASVALNRLIKKGLLKMQRKGKHVLYVLDH